MVSTPKAPDPKETAAAQAGMNRDTAITQQNLNMIDQITPTGSLTYTRTGNTFTPSENGTDYWYNAASGEYRTGSPGISGYRTENVAGTPGSIKGGDGGWVKPGTDASTRQVPIYEDGWEQVKGNLDPKWTATTSYSPEQQKIFDQSQAATLNLSTLANEQSEFLRDYLKKGVDTSGVPALQGSIGGGYSGDIGGSYRTSYDPGYTTDLGSDFRTDLGPDWKTTYAGADDFSADRQRYEDAVRARMAPDLAKTRQATEAQLIGRGLRPGTAAFNSEMDRIQRGENDASISAILAGGNEQARMVGMARDAAGFNNQAILDRANFGNNATYQKAAFGNDAIAKRFAAENAASLGAADFRNNSALTSANFNNAARAQGLQEAYAQSNDPINKITALLGASQVQQPNFVSTPTTGVAGVDYSGLVSDKYKADLAASQSVMGGLFGLLAAPFSMFGTSDRRAKRGIRRIGTLPNGLPWYRFRYFWDAVTAPAREGVMADEVRKLIPEAVISGRNGGFDAVDYSMILEAA